MKIMKIHLFIVTTFMLLILPLTLANNCVWLPSDIYDEAFDQHVLDLMALGPIESCAFSVLHGTDVFYSKGFGDQPGTDVAYYLLSCGKTFTATAFLLLYEQGLIDLDDNINNYLPYELKNPNHPTSIITIKHLLSHHSSISSDPSPPMYLEGLLNGSSLFPSTIYNFWHEDGPFYSPDYWYDWEPGTEFHYADIGYDVLALAFENITETTLIDYITTNILDPLGMTNTKNDFTDYSADELAIGYNWNATSQTNEVSPNFNASLIPGAGGFYSTVEDMAIWMLTHLNQGEYNGVRILNETSIELMHTEISNSDYALGWWTEREIAGRTYQGHGGGPFAGFATKFYIKGTLGVIFLCNQGVGTGFQNSIFDHIFDLALKLLQEKTCKTNLYFLPIIGSIFIIAILNFLKKRRKN